MKDLFDYLRKREGKVFLNADGKKFYGEIHLIIHDGKILHTKDWQTNDIAMVVESKKV